jgi:nucleotide-binding universal stress UspA family protein
MRALVWVVEGTWKATVSAAGALLPADTEMTLLYVASTDAETVARGALQGLLGRPRTATAQPLNARSDQSSHDLLSSAQNLLGRQTACVMRHGRIEREVVAAAAGMDVLVLARDGDRKHPGPRSLGPAARFVVDHAPCAVLLVWPDFLLSSGQD